MDLTQELRQAAKTAETFMQADLLIRAAEAIEAKNRVLYSCIQLFINDLQGLPLIQPELKECQAALSAQGEKK